MSCCSQRTLIYLLHSLVRTRLNVPVHVDGSLSRTQSPADSFKFVSVEGGGRGPNRLRLRLLESRFQGFGHTVWVGLDHQKTAQRAMCSLVPLRVVVSRACR